MLCGEEREILGGNRQNKAVRAAGGIRTEPLKVHGMKKQDSVCWERNGAVFQGAGKPLRKDKEDTELFGDTDCLHRRRGEGMSRQ